MAASSSVKDRYGDFSLLDDTSLWKAEGPHVGEVLERRVFLEDGSSQTKKGTITGYAAAHLRRPEVFLWEESTTTTTKDQHTSEQVGQDTMDMNGEAEIVGSKVAEEENEEDEVEKDKEEEGHCVVVKSQVLVESDFPKPIASSSANKKKKRGKKAAVTSSSSSSSQQQQGKLATVLPSNVLWQVIQERIDYCHHQTVHKSILPKCLMWALVEEAWSIYLRKTDEKKESGTTTFNNNNNKSSSFQIPFYYSRPNSNNDDQIVVTSPTTSNLPTASVSTLINRMRAGAQLAYQHFVHSGTTTTTSTSSKRQQDQRKSPRLSSDSYPIDIWQRGGRVARYLLAWKEEQEMTAAVKEEEQEKVVTESSKEKKKNNNKRASSKKKKNKKRRRKKKDYDTVDDNIDDLLPPEGGGEEEEEGQERRKSRRSRSSTTKPERSSSGRTSRRRAKRQEEEVIKDKEGEQDEEMADEKENVKGEPTANVKEEDDDDAQDVPVQEQEGDQAEVKVEEAETNEDEDEDSGERDDDDGMKADDAEQSSSKEKDEPKTKGEAKKKKKKKKEPKTILIDAFEEEEDDDDDDEEDHKDEDFDVEEAEEEEEDDHEDLDDMEEVVKESAVLEDAKKPKKRKRMKKAEEVLTEEEEDEKEDEDEDDDDDDDNQEDIDYVLTNPFLKPTKLTLLEWLGRRGKSLTLLDIQQTVVNCMENELVLEQKALSPTDQVVLGGQKESWMLGIFDDLDSLSKYDPSTFSKSPLFLTCQLLIDKHWSEQELVEQQLKEEKTVGAWRFKGIHGGCAIWPSWQDAVQQRYKVEKGNRGKEKDEVEEAEETITENDAAIAQSLSTSRRSTRRGNMSDGGVFYGAQSQVSQKQLMQTILRFCRDAPSHTMTSLQALVAEDANNPVQRLRVALGRLVWKRHQVLRKPVTSLWSDEPLWNALKAESICTVKEGTRGVGDKVRNLCDYIRTLHQTELKLRNLVLRHMTTSSTVTIATAADEHPGTLETVDGAVFDDPKSIDWQESGHDWIGKLVFRPSKLAPDLADLNLDCRWYKVVGYVPSVPAEDAEEAHIVERRMRFRVRPATAEGEYAAEGPLLVLTQGQVHAGMKAAEQELQSLNQSKSDHPFSGGVGTRITMQKDGSDIPSVIAGYDTVYVPNGGSDRSIQHQLLILPLKKPGGEVPEAFWASIEEDDDGCVVCVALEGEERTYKLEQSDYDSGSPAFYACMSIVEYLKKLKNSNVFMEPVDPVALNIPSYFSVVKHPMDISTLEENLEKGLYSKIPAKQSIGRTPVARMLNGPFRDDAVRIFDNAILFNPPDDWIHQTAISMKKMLIKKLEQAAFEAEGNIVVSASRRNRGGERRSVYVDDDSDVDMYEYESDHDDEFIAGSGRRGRSRGQKRKKKRKTNRDDFSTLAVEGPVRLQHALHIEGLRGPFASLPIVSDASGFSLSSEWSCQHSSKKNSKPKEKQELDDMLALQRQAEENERMGLRRSARSHLPGENPSGDDEALAMEYRLKEAIMGLLPSTPTNRSEVESSQEFLHEKVYAHWYQEHSKQLSWSSRNGKYSNDSFPPYLGTVSPSTSLEDESVVWEIRSNYVIPALRWIIRGLVHSGHLTALDPMMTESLSSGIVMTNDVYIYSSDSFDVLEVQRRGGRRKNEADDSSEEEIEMSEYEKLRADRVARNAERLKMLGLA